MKHKSASLHLRYTGAQCHIHTPSKAQSKICQSMHQLHVTALAVWHTSWEHLRTSSASLVLARSYITIASLIQIAKIDITYRWNKYIVDIIDEYLEYNTVQILHNISVSKTTNSKVMKIEIIVNYLIICIKGLGVMLYSPYDPKNASYIISIFIKDKIWL